MGDVFVRDMMSGVYIQLKALDLLKAISRDEFLLYYQPQFHVETGKFESMEVLLRWQHPEYGLIMPQDFVPLAEETKLIIPIGEYVLRKACQQCKHWHDKGLPFLRIAVNVSWTQIQLGQLDLVVGEVLEEIGLDAKWLELELTENILLHGTQAKLIDSINRIKKMGVTVTLDDFGTGYSSISHLKVIPIDRIKIDKSYIENIHTNGDDLAIVRAIIALGDSLNLKVMAEGVETLRQMKLLSGEGCMEMQGFYFSEPIPADEFERFIVFYQTRSFL